jgi:glutathione S-transferase
MWFTNYHLANVSSAISRYRKEIQRVVGVLDTVLKDRKYLVGDKLTIADLVFVPWNFLIPVCRRHSSLTGMTINL